MHEIEGYRLERRLGAGGFATVWLGFDERLDGHVAIKILADNWTGDPDVTSRFVEEARFMWKADDPRIVRVHTVGEMANGQPYFVMEFADRGTLSQRIQEGLIAPGALSLEDRVGLIKEIAACIEAVHDSGALHRDVKPDNFLIRSGRHREQQQIPGLASDERLLIADLGLAKNVVAASGVSIAAGSPGYMSPEQADVDGRVDQRVDIFALGVIAFEILAGELPFAKSRFSTTALLESVDQIPLVSSVSPAVPAVFDSVLRKAMHPVADGRYADVAGFVADLDGALAATSNQATFVSTPPSPPRPSQPVIATPPAPSQPVTPPAPSQPVTPPAPSQPVTPTAPSQPAAKPARFGLIAGAIAALVAVIAIVAFATTRGSTDPELADAPIASTTVAEPTTTSQPTPVSEPAASTDASSSEEPLLLGGEIRLPAPAVLDTTRSSGLVSAFTVSPDDLDDVVDALVDRLRAAGFTIDANECCVGDMDVRATRDEAGGSGSVFVSIGEGSRSQDRFTFLWSET